MGGEVMVVEVSDPSLVLLIGPSGAGKSTFARAHFAATEIVSSDACRALVSDDENEQSATADAFRLVHLIVEKRLARGLMTVVDATNVTRAARKPLLDMARRFHLPAIAIVFDASAEMLEERRVGRRDRVIGAEAVHRQRSLMHESMRSLLLEGFQRGHRLDAAALTGAISVSRTPLPPDHRHESGPFDIIGDVHGCATELRELLDRLAYPTSGRRMIFVGDLVDRGPATPDVLRIVMEMVEQGSALCVPGNHDWKLARKLRGRDVKVAHGLAESLEQLERETSEFRAAVGEFIDSLPTHLVLDGGKLIVAHAGMKPHLQGRESRRVRDFALYGETTGEVDEVGLPVRVDWAARYRGQALVVYGHTPVREPRWVNHTVNIDTGCVFGGALTAFRYPELETISVPALRTYAASIRGFADPV